LGYGQTGKPKDQVKADVPETGSPGRFYGIYPLPGSMTAFHRLQVGVIKRLDSNAQPVHTKGQQCAAVGDCKVSGIAFHSYLGGLHPFIFQIIAQQIKDRGKFSRLAYRRGAAAQIKSMAQAECSAAP